MVIRMRHTRAHTRNRRSHHALKESTIATCANCASATRPHHMCLVCGFYKGRQVLDLGSAKVKRDARIKSKHDRIRLESGTQGAPTQTETHGKEEIKDAVIDKVEKKTRTRKVSQGGSSEKVKGDIL